jgi:hypothetical protein
MACGLLTKLDLLSCSKAEFGEERAARLEPRTNRDLHVAVV